MLLTIGLFLVTTSWAQEVFHPTAETHSITPHQISKKGGVITIYGKDFAADNFNQFDPNLGNKVILFWIQ